MDLVIVTPARPGSQHGNRHTALRWSAHLKALGHRVSVQVRWDGRPCDAMIALHARRSHDSMHRWKAAQATRPLVLVLTGTDLYRDIRSDASAKVSLALADRLVVLQQDGFRELPARLRSKTTLVYQSVRSVARQPPPRSYVLVTVIGHLREEKDPFRAALALTHLPDEKRLRIVHLGNAMSPAMAREARAQMRADPRYRWLGEVPHPQAMRWLARSHAMVISSRMEGGAHVVSEAIAIGVPVIASRISGNTGLLGKDYAGYYPVGDERALAKRLGQVVNDATFLHLLKRQMAARKSLTRPAAERQALKQLIDAL